MNFKQAMDYINNFSHSGKRITDLSRISGLLQRLGNPQKSLKFVHIAGTNGKGSVLEYCSNAFINGGIRTGQFTSPYILTLLMFTLKAKLLIFWFRKRINITVFSLAESLLPPKRRQTAI